MKEEKEEEDDETNLLRYRLYFWVAMCIGLTYYALRAMGLLDVFNAEGFKNTSVALSSIR